MLSWRYTLVSHDIVGDIVVGRVNVDVNMYDMVPLSNYKYASVRPKQCVGKAYIYTAGKALIGEFQLEIEMVNALCQPAFTTKYHLVFKERGESIAEIASTLLTLSRAYGGTIIPIAVARAVWILEDLGIAME
jgi:hypothetical protein